MAETSKEIKVAAEVTPTEEPAFDRTKFNLYQKIAAIMGEIGAVEKEGFNVNQKYAFVTEATIANLLRPLFAKYGIVPWHSLKEWSRPDRTTYTVETWRLIDADTGEMTIETDMLSEGMDAGDKSSSKASTFSSKYFYLRQFVIGSGTKEEAEADEKTDKAVAAEAAKDGPVRVTRGKQAGVQRGGKSDHATTAQVSEIAKQAKNLGLTTVEEIIPVIAKIIGSEPAEGQEIREWLGGLTSEQASGIITSLAGMATFADVAVDTSVDSVDGEPEDRDLDPENVEEQGLSIV
jgi:hypothetical protein